jgi:hypothetical protein
MQNTRNEAPPADWNLAGMDVTTTTVLENAQGQPAVQLRERDGEMRLSLLTVTGAWQGFPLQPALEWLRQNRPGLFARTYKPPSDWVTAALEFCSTATGAEWAEAERYYLQVYARWTHQRSGITGATLPPLRACPPLVQAGWLAVAREKFAFQNPVHVEVTASGAAETTSDGQNLRRG